MTKVAVASRSFSKNLILRDALLARYPDTTFNDAGESLSGESLIRFLSGHEKAITALETVSANVLKALPDLKVLSKYGVGFEMLDLIAIRERGIRLGWTPGANKRSVSELALHMMIGLLRQIPHGSRQVLAGNFRQVQGPLLSERTVGIIGFGHVGQDLGHLLRAFGTTVLAHDLRSFPSVCAETGITQVDLDSLLATSDIVTLHLPLDKTTDTYLDAARLDQLPTGAFVINTARGGLVDEAALKDRLLSGRLGGAGLDVFRPEPPDDMDLLAMDCVMATPHIGGSAIEAVLAMGYAAIDGLDNNRIPDATWPPGY